MLIADHTKTSVLNLRRGVVPAEVLAVLPPGTQVHRIDAIAQRPEWWRVRVELAGAGVEGFVNSACLTVAPATVLPKPLAGLPAADLPRKGHRRRDAYGRAYPLDEPGMPQRDTADPARTLAILEWLKPEESRHARWQSGDTKTFCNIYACDFRQRMGGCPPCVWRINPGSARCRWSWVRPLGLG